MNVRTQSFSLSMYLKIVNLFQSSLARAGIWLFIGGVAGGLFGYIFQIAVGRMLTTQEYSLFNAMMAVSTILSAPLGTLMMVVSRKVSEYRAKKEYDLILHFYSAIHRRNILFGSTLLFILILFADQIQMYLKTQSVTQVYILGLFLLAGTLMIINNAFLQGLQLFSLLSGSGVINSGFKIIFAIAFIAIGYGVTGAITGATAAVLFTVVITYLVLRKPLAAGNKTTKKLLHLDFNSALPVLIANITFAIMTQLDLVFVNYFFSAHEAGLYAAASVLGKAVLYLPGGVASALYPMVAENETNGKDSVYLLLQALGLVILLCGAGAIFYYLFGEQLILFLYGKNYSGAGEILKFYGFAIMPMALVMVAEHFLIAKGKVLFAYLFLPFAPIQILALYYHHQSLKNVLLIIAMSGFFLASTGYFLLWRTFRKKSI